MFLIVIFNFLCTVHHQWPKEIKVPWRFFHYCSTNKCLCRCTSKIRSKLILCTHLTSILGSTHTMTRSNHNGCTF